MFIQSILIAVATLAPASEALSNDEVLHQAESEFHEGSRIRQTPDAAGRFLKAAGCYEELHQRGARNAALYRNEGNAYLLADDLAHAILSYRRGLLLAPNDRELQADLAYARDRVVYPAPGVFARPPIENWPPWLLRPVPGMCLVLFFLSYALLWTALTRWWMVRRAWLLCAAAASLLILVLLALSLSVESWRSHQEASHPLVVVAEDGVLMRKGNGLAYPASYDIPLNRGVEARLRCTRGDWLQIELSAGEVGWVHRNSIVPGRVT